MPNDKFEAICAAYWHAEVGVRLERDHAYDRKMCWDAMPDEDEDKQDVRRGMAAALRELKDPGAAVKAAGCERVGSIQYAETVWQAMLDELLSQVPE